MTVGSENLGNGSTKSDRFPGKYRGARREGAVAEETPPGDELGPRDNGPVELDAVGVDRSPKLPSLDLGGLAEPVFPPAGWSDVPGPSLVDHPLLRGLLLELPPKGCVPSSAWLDRWFEAARSILELLYVQDPGRTR
jgi:hypothetical protein